MYNLVIVEDEDIIREGLVKSIDWKSLGFNIIVVATNGLEALDSIGTQYPDVLLTDIRMPVMDGLELSKKIKEKYSNIEIVVLSGFADFEYAREAIRVKVFEYLLKPTNKKKFVETFKRLKKELDRRNDEDNASQLNNIRANEALLKLREEFLSSLLDGDFVSTYTLEEKMDYLELDLNGKYYIAATLCLEGDDSKLLKDWGYDKNLIYYAYANIITELIEAAGKGTVLSKSPKEIIIIFIMDDQEKIIMAVKEIISISITYIKKLLFNNDQIEIYGGIGKIYEDILELSKSYIESKRALEERFFVDDKAVFEFDKKEDIIKEGWIKDYSTEANNIISEAISGNVEKIDSMINDFFNNFDSNTSSKYIKSSCYVLCFLLKSNLDEFNINIGHLNLVELENRINSTSKLEDLKEYIINLFKKITNEINELSNVEYSYHRKVIEKAKKFIEENYDTNISLEEIGSHVFLSPTYLSFLFKSVTGETYSDYLKKVRIEKAKELLNRIDLKIYEVANKVGYNDYKYFTTQFKKYVGISPTEYRNKGILNKS